MNCYIMAAGNGYRLRPLTSVAPKCLLPVGGKPMIQWWLDAVFTEPFFDNVFVNLHHCGDQVEKWLTDYFYKTGNPIEIIDERERLLGTAGTLFWYGDTTKDFCVIYADTFCEYAMKNLFQMIREFIDSKETGMLAGLLGFPSPNDGSAGIMEIDAVGTLKGFSEKASGTGGVAWSGVMAARKELYHLIKKDDYDLAGDVFPRIVNASRVIALADAYDIGRGIKEYEELNEKLRQAQRHPA